MNAWQALVMVLCVGTLTPGLVLGCTGRAERRLLGLELTGVALTLTLLVLAQATGESNALIVPLVLAVLSCCGVLVFTRLLGDRS